MTAWLPAIGGFFGPSSADYQHLVTEVVRRGSFQITVTERGAVDSLRNAILASKVEGATTIISIVPEGTQVKAGDLVCELDSSVLVDKETQQQILVTQARAALDQAREDKAIQETQNESDIAAADLMLTLAKLDLDKFEQGDYKQQRVELDSQVQVNKENLARAKEYLSFLERLVKKGYRMQSDLDAERIAYSKANNDLVVAVEKFRVLENFTKLRTSTELEANVKEYAREMDRVVRKSKAALLQKVALLESKDLTFEVETSKHKRLLAQIEACKIYAPQDGQVVYANTRDGRSSDQVMIDVGASVRERQPIINLPDLDSMKVNARIHESRISLVRPGYTATIKVDAAPTETFHGEVDVVSSVPSSLNSFNRDLKEYEAVVRLTDDVDMVNRLRPGLTATVEILVSQRDDVLQAPVQCLISVLDKRFAYVLGGQGPELKEIEIGQTNERTVEILKGLSEGDRVIMNPRSQFAKDIGELETRLAKEKMHAEPESRAKSEGHEPVPSDRPVEKAGPAARSPGGESEQAPPRPDPLARFQSMDQNHDGKLSADELSERMRPRFDDMDTDHSGAIDQKEFTAFASQFRPRNSASGGD